MSNRLLLPCVRGTIGDWVTYVCMMRLKDIANLIGFAKEVHSSKGLSDMIQRNLKDKRTREIGNYLLNDPESFFNSLVVGIYQGDPKWHQFDSITKKPSIDLSEYEYPEYADDSMGFLSLNRNESIFALDGQHRLAGIKFAINENPDLGYKQLPVIFLPHYNTVEGLKRTRRLFTSLNKKAKPVEKEAIIALDEDDLAAVATRFLVEETEYFNENKLKYSAQNNISGSDLFELTTIGNLYDVAMIILKCCAKKSKAEVSNFRGSFEERKKLIYQVEDTFSCLFEEIPALLQYQTKGASRDFFIERYRSSEFGGHLLYRPIGLKLFFEVLADYCKREISDFDTVSRYYISSMSDFDFDMGNELFSNKIWDPVRKKMISSPSSDDKKLIKDAIFRHVDSKV